MNAMETKVVRAPHIAEKIVFIDGISGCGKTMFCPIIAALPRVQLYQFLYELEYVCALHFLGRMEKDAVEVLIRMLTDLKLYNIMMSRETNFRFSDVSSVFRNAKIFTGLKRLFQAGDAAAVERIKEEKPILSLITHSILAFGEPIFSALGSRVVFIELVRHPLYMINLHAMYQDRHGVDPRDFTIWHEYENRALPYFTKGWEEIYIRSNAVEKFIHNVYFYNKRVKELQLREVLEIPFERFVLNPWSYMNQIESLLDTKIDGRTRRMMKRQKIPREKIADGLALKIYKHYGWKPPMKGMSERKELEERRKFAMKHASPDAMKILDGLCAEYEEKHLKDIL